MKINPNSPVGVAQAQRNQLSRRDNLPQSPTGGDGLNWGRMPGDFAHGFKWGAPFGLMSGNAPGVVGAGLLGGAGEVVAGQMEEFGYGLPAQIGGSMAAEVGLGLATKSAPRVAGALSRNLGEAASKLPQGARGPLGAVARLGSRQERAKGLIQGVGLDKLMKQEGPESVVRRFQQGVANLRDRETLAWNAARSADTSGIKGSMDKIDGLVTSIVGDDFRLNPGALPEIFNSLVKGKLLKPGSPNTGAEQLNEIGVKELKLLYSSINDAFSKPGGMTDNARQALTSLRKEVDNVADEMQEMAALRAGPEDMNAMDLLKEARAMSRTIGEVTDDSSYFIRELAKGQENYATVMDKMFSGPTPLADIERIRKAATAVSKLEGQTGTNLSLERGLARAAVQHVLKRAQGASGEAAPATAGTVARKLEHIMESDEISAIESAMGGSDKARFLLDIAEQIFADAKAGNKFSPILNLARQASWSMPGGIGGKTVGAGAALSVGGMAGAGVAGLLGLSVMDDVFRAYGKTGVNMVAIDALSNRKTMERLLSHTPDNQRAAVVSDMMDDILRRGGIEIAQAADAIEQRPMQDQIPAATDSLNRGRPQGIYPGK